MDVLNPANLLAWAIQAGVIVFVAAPLPRLLGLWSPRVRMVFWRVVFVACLLLPLLQPWATPAVGVDRMWGAGRSPVQPIGASVEVQGTASATGVPAPATPDAPPAGAGWAWPSPTVARNVIAAGIVLRLGWLGLGLVTVSRLRRSSSRLWPRPPSIDRAATLAETDAEFLVSATTSRPVTCGLLWPVVMVPRNFESFPEHEQTAIACHELLHVSRADWVRNGFDEIVRAVLWFHPAIWWLINQIQLAREQVVDREAVRRLGERQPYLEALLRLARPAPRLILTPASLFLKRAHLRQRVTLLVKEVSMSKARLVASLAIMAIVVFIGGRLVTAAFPLQQSGARTPGVQTATQLDSTTPLTFKFTAGIPVQQALGFLSQAAGLTLTTEGDLRQSLSTPMDGFAVDGVTIEQVLGMVLRPVGLTYRVTGPHAIVVQRAAGAVAGGVAGGVSGGVAGAVAGGVAGGVPNGVAGGVSGGVAGAVRPGVLTGTGTGVAGGVSGGASAGVSGGIAGGVSGGVAGGVTPGVTTGTGTGIGSGIGSGVVGGALSGGVQGAVPGGGVGGSPVARPAPTLSETVHVAGQAPGSGLSQGATTPSMSFSSTPRVVTRIDPLPTGQSGAVVVKVAVDPRGVVSDAQVVSANGGSELAALDAARQWVFGPSPAAWATYIGFSFAGELPAGAPPTSVGGNIRPPRKIADFKPFYPPEAQQARIEGVQIIEAMMGPSGDVIDAWALRGHEALIGSAINAVLHWRFEPALVNGEPMPIKMTVTVNFTLGNGPGTTGSATAVRDNAAARGEQMPPAQHGSATNWPTEAVRVGGNIRPPSKTVDVRAVYPDAAQKARVQGVVICEVLIGPDGKVADARILRSIPLLDQAAYDAVRQWEFTPTLLNGNPVSVIMTVTVNFTLQ